MSENPLKNLADFYSDSVKESDKKGFAEIYKKSTEIVFKDLCDDSNEYYNTKISIKNVEYLDGYFIFGMGTNSVVHFNIEELPGWKFGLWWNEPKDNKAFGNILTGQLFAQHEATIDKFKPSRSEICDDIQIELDTDMCDCFNVIRDIVFMIKEPELAFCRSAYGLNYNNEYLSRVKAKRLFKKYMFNEKKSNKITAFLNKSTLNYLSKLFKNELNNGVIEIIDNGENYSPRYRIKLVKSIASQYMDLNDVEVNGFYDLDGFIDDKLFKKIVNREKLCNFIAKIFNVYWDYPFNYDILVAE